MPVIAEPLAEAETQLSVYRALEREAGGTLKLCALMRWFVSGWNNWCGNGNKINRGERTQC